MNDKVTALCRKLPIAGTAVIIALGSSTLSYSESVNKMPEITGVWAFDKTYVREFLTAGSKLQQRWCGYGWSDAEIERRIQIVERDTTIPNLSFKRLNGETYTKTVFPVSDTPETTTLSHCTLVKNEQMQCETGSNDFAAKGYPDLDKAYLRRKDQYLFLDVPAHKTMMLCPRSHEPPDEIEWTSLRYVKQ